jgi:hypothetical protein
VYRGLALTAVALFVTACGGGSFPPPAGATAAATPAITPMPAGTYTTVSFSPAMTFTVPDGWVMAEDSPLYAVLMPASNAMIGLHVFRDPKAASQDSTCAASPEPGIGGTSSELVKWISARPGLVVSTPAMATIGGLPGVAIDVALRADWTQPCPFSDGTPAVPLFNSPAIDHWVVVGNERLRLYLLDLPGGGTIVVNQDAFDGDQIEDLISSSSGLLRSLQFADVPASAAPASTTP